MTQRSYLQRSSAGGPEVVIQVSTRNVEAMGVEKFFVSSGIISIAGGLMVYWIVATNY